MSNSTSNHQSSDTYCCQIEGLPRRYTWQALKDLARREAPHGLFADVQIYPYVTGRGYIRAQGRNDVEALYRFLTENEVEGQWLSVTLWDISQSHGPPQFLKCNNRAAFNLDAQRQKVAHIADSSQWQVLQTVAPNVHLASNTAFAPAPLESTHADYFAGPGATTTHIHHQQAPYMSFHQQSYEPTPDFAVLPVPSTIPLPYNQAQQSSKQQRSQPQYLSMSHGTPVNISRGYLETETRGIFVSSLSYKARTQDIENHFARAGKIIKCELHKDATTGKSKGKATIEYAKAEEAGHAIEMFNGKSWMNIRLVVRLDKEAARVSRRPSRTPTTTDSTEPGPLIVNGSGGMQLHS